MLNISNNSVKTNTSSNTFRSFKKLEYSGSRKVLRRMLFVGFLLILVVLFLPWTQNIRAYGKVITLKADQRPQKLYSLIGGKIEKWYVKEGDNVERGDTLLFISEIKVDYFDSSLLDRTSNQVDLKVESAKAYEQKVNTLDEQLLVLSKNRSVQLEQGKIKVKQSQLKMQNDSAAYETAKINVQIAQEQFDRMQQLYDQGLKSKTDYEARKLKLQQSQAYEIEAKNKWLSAQNDWMNNQMNLSAIRLKYDNDLAKIRSEKFSTLSELYETEVSINKLNNQYTNYEKRNGLYYIISPIDGYVTRMIQNGPGEIVKEAEEILTIMPDQYDLAVEVYVDPIDLPLLEIGDHARLQFDGWPALVFSGWPGVSAGTFGGKVYAIDQFIGENGKFRVLIAPDPEDKMWPSALRFGGGVSSMMLLSDVPVGYELWRKINGFPPEYYTVSDERKTDK